MKTSKELAAHEVLKNLTYLRSMRGLNAKTVLLSCGAKNALEALEGTVITPESSIDVVLQRADVAFTALKKASDVARTSGQRRWYALLYGRFCEGLTTKRLSEIYSISQPLIYKNLQKAEQAFMLHLFGEETNQV